MRQMRSEARSMEAARFGSQRKMTKQPSTGMMMPARQIMTICRGRAVLDLRVISKKGLLLPGLPSSSVEVSSPVESPVSIPSGFSGCPFESRIIFSGSSEGRDGGVVSERVREDELT